MAEFNSLLHPHLFPASLLLIQSELQLNGNVYIFGVFTDLLRK